MTACSFFLHRVGLLPRHFLHLPMSIVPQSLTYVLTQNLTYVLILSITDVLKLDRTKYTPGYNLYIEPFEYELLGVSGKVIVSNGGLVGYDTGVIYYEFIPRKETPEMQPAIAFDTLHEYYEENIAVTIDISSLKKTIGFAMVIVSLASPLPGDEALAIGAFLALQ